MTPEIVIEFLTKVLGEQGYNLRNPDEVIAYFCHSREKINNYADFLRIKTEYEKRAARAKVDSKEQTNYTMFAKANLAFTLSLSLIICPYSPPEYLPGFDTCFNIAFSFSFILCTP
jgi:hypothetical protein